MSNYQGSEPLIQYIRDEIANTEMHRITFSRFMELCLYHPTEGYYMTERPKIGKEGDFYTSSSLGSLMGEMLASYIARSIEEDFSMDEHAYIRIIEWGAGTGRLGLQILEALEQEWPQIHKHIRYTIVEQSPYHQAESQQAFAAAHRTAEWWTPENFQLQAHEAPAFILANELLDALPVERVRWNSALPQGKLEQQVVAWDSESNSFRAEWAAAERQLELYMQQYVASPYIDLTDYQQFEINLGGLEWLRQVSASLKQGRIIVIDYGDVTKELVAPHRMLGTFVCYYRHQAHDNPFNHVGQQDMTSHVDFNAIQQAGEQSGLETLVYETQKQFLIRAGLLGRLQSHFTSDPFDPIARKNRAIRQLLLSDQMSELFKVWIARKKTIEA